MAVFTDMLGRAWKVRIVTSTVDRLKEAGFDLDAGEEAFQVLSRPKTFGLVFWALCGDQAEKAGITPEEFKDGFDGDAFERAFTALCEALADFTHPSPVAKELKGRIPDRLAAGHRLMIARIKDEASGNTSGNLPASPASIPAS